MEKHTEIMKYLKNLTNKLIKISERLDKIEEGLDTVTKKTIQLGTACGRAFEMTKTVVQELSEHQKDLSEDLGEYGGIICESSWM